MKIDLTYQYEVCQSAPVLPIKFPTGSALPLELKIPESLAGGSVESVEVTIVNADGESVTGAAVKSGGEWFVTFAPTCFLAYGYVCFGFKATAYVSRPDGTRVGVSVVGDLEITQASASAQPGDPTAAYQEAGGDVYKKSYVDESGVQHYVLEVLVHDPDIGWGLDWTGDYVKAGGEFVAYVQEDGE